MNAASKIQPFSGELHAGDAALIHQTKESITCILLDITGHGLKAANLAKATLKHLNLSEVFTPSSYINQLHEILKNSLGAAASVLKVTNCGKIHYCGVGNVLCKKISLQNVEFVSKNGVLGQGFHSLFEQENNLEHGDLLIMTTDGVSVRYQHELNFYKNDTVESIAHTIVRDHGKSTDDSGCIVLRY